MEQTQAMKTLLLTFLISLSLNPFVLDFSIYTSPEAAFTSLESAFKSGDVNAIMSHADEKILLEINNGESVYSKAQAFAILTVFFNRHKPQDFILKSKSLNKGNYALIGTLITEKKNFRVSIKLRESGQLFFLDKIVMNPV